MTQPQTPVNLDDLIAQGRVQAPPEQLDQEHKEQLAEAGTPFTINSIQYGDSGDFGPYWQFDVNVQGTAAQFRLSCHESRDAFIQSMAAITAQHPISGVRLRAIATRGGNKFLTIEPA